ncbi:aspartate/glutamate racemase family protein [Marivita sp. XM-24bin2]|jgi:Asp/Glu/hydantoin racemase|uniref:aspartate/glutamate racemase family protein n=1 Tax=unclassified Marivita TaxID=2632480 RepID=UPI000D7A1F96|nr:aspartate/glutamate racemase family protein [Marivita sp. XM-24bin2]MCR9107971.1 aspartate/glutamate racemase family protein [Paracoccaceae bacterium]PWL35049.1 MAG: Asp/Glu racemase [Marivita sp. XM-24bin2]
MSGPILVINPNSNEAVTEGLRDALGGFNLPGGPAIECLTLKEGPFGIESQRDSDSVILPLADLMQSRPDAGAFVIACYSDPGLETCRSVVPQPVFGIQESGVLTAMARADRFGVVAIADGSIPRHRRYMARMQVLDRLACEIALNMTVDESARGQGTFARLAEVGAVLKSQGAGAVILGCAGMARHRAPLQAELAVPVIEPTQAAVSMALGTLLAG